MLQIVELVRLIWKQTTIDIFLVDWEKPRVLPNQKQNGMITDAQKQTVSIWRSYFVANEWAEIQTKRKISSPMQLLFTVFLLKVCLLKILNDSQHSYYIKYRFIGSRPIKLET